MGFGEAIKSFYKRYFDFQTRSTRSEYWWVMLFQFLVAIVLLIPIIIGLSMAETTPGDGVTETGGLFVLIGMLPLILFYIANFIPSIAVAVRRFHDQDKSGWFYLLALIPYVGGIVLIVFMILEGTRGPNRFGPDPLGGGLGETFS